MRKTLWACVAASALSLAFTATSFAAVNYGENNNNLFTYDETNNTITITGDLSACGEDATVLVLKPLATDATITDDDILYITQEKAADKATALAGLGLKGETLTKDVEYTVKVGGTNITSTDAILVGTFKIADAATPEEVTFTWGDVTGDKIADIEDASAILFAKTEGATKKFENSPYEIGQTVSGLKDSTNATVADFVWGDVTGDNIPDIEDASAILFAKTEGATKKFENSPYEIDANVTLYK